MKTVDILKELIKFPSFSGQEKELQLFIQKLLKSQNVESISQGNNLIVHIKGKDQTSAFIFNGHVDVVHIGDKSKWQFDPFTPKSVGPKLYGRGSSDMKSGVAAMITTAISLSKKSSLPCDVWFTFVGCEETDGSGTLSFGNWFKKEGFLKKYQNISSIFAEPTNLKNINYGHRGNFFIKAKIDGQAGHSARPENIKIQAILKMNKFISELDKLNIAWSKKFKKSEFKPPTIVTTSIEAKSDSPNKTADECVAGFDLRTIPNFHDEAFQIVKGVAKKYNAQTSLTFPSFPYGYTNPQAKIVKVIQKLVPESTPKVNDASNDLGFFTTLGIEGVMFGPGNMDQAHAVNEYVDVAQVEKAPALFEKIYFAWTK